MDISVCFSGIAGQGVNTAGTLLGDFLAKRWYHVVGDKEYASIIKGDNNSFTCYISDSKPYVSKQIDYFFGFDELAFEKNGKVYDLKNLYRVNPKDSGCTYENTYAVAAACKILGLPLAEMTAYLTDKYSSKPDVLAANLKDAQAGYEKFETLHDLSGSIGTPKEFWYGNQIIGRGAIAAGLGRYSAYPMTPASTLIPVVQERPDQVTFLQWEDEIAVSMSMLGAKFAGKRAMCGTSGGGFALMTESISYAHQAEIGGVWVLVQRDWPSTGNPTFLAQGDVSYALNSSFGDTFSIVVAPSTFENGYRLIGKALNRGSIYQQPVIYLSDKQFSEHYITVNPADLVPEPIQNGKLELAPAEDFARYKNSDDGVSSYSIPGALHGEFNATSYTHDEYSATDESPANSVMMEIKRHTKMQTFINNEYGADFKGYEIIRPEAKVFFVTFGVHQYVIEKYLEAHPDHGLIVVHVLQPLNPALNTRLQEHFEQIEKLIFIEMNYSGQFEFHLTSHLELQTPARKAKITSHRKYDLYPYTVEYLWDTN